MKYTFTDQFMSDNKNRRFAEAVMMGPNSMRVGEELTLPIRINQDMRILDLGCGMGLSTIFLAQKFGASVFAADLWIGPTDNYERFKSFGIEDKAIPISLDATKGLPFANGYFDVLFSVGAYQYFADKPDMLSTLIPFVKKGGYIAISLNGIKDEFGKNVPNEMKPFWNEDVERTMHSLEWWRELWSKEKGIEILDISEMTSHKQAWDEWLDGYRSDLPFAEVVAEAIKMMKAENGQYFNTIQLIAKVI